MCIAYYVRLILQCDLAKQGLTKDHKHVEQIARDHVGYTAHMQTAPINTHRGLLVSTRYRC